MKFTIYLLLVIFSFIFVNYKISKIARIIAFKETESKKEANVSFILLIVVSILFAIYTF